MPPHSTIPAREQTDAERFWSKVDRRGPDDCWPWRGGTKHGYGYFWFGNRDVRAHRWAYEQEVGPIPDGLTVDHLCRTRACQNTRHMELVTSRENTLRGVGLSAVNAQKTHCVHGHEFTPENTYRVPVTRYRVCRTCRAALEKARERSRAGEGGDDD